MLLPIRCMSCRSSLGHYELLLHELIKAKVPPAEILEKLGITAECCRIHVITQMYIMDYY